jgi:hypothetical protein
MSTTRCASIEIFPTSRRGCAGANGCCAPKRRSSPRQSPRFPRDARRTRRRRLPARRIVGDIYGRAQSAALRDRLRRRWLAFSDSPRHAETLRALAGAKGAAPPSFTKLEMLALSAIAYQQPVTRAQLSRLAGHDISRDILGRLKSLGVIAPWPRAPMPGARIAWVTTAPSSKCLRSGTSAICPISTRSTPPAPGVDATEGVLDDALGLFETKARQTMTRSIRPSGRRDERSLDEPMKGDNPPCQSFPSLGRLPTQSMQQERRAHPL